MPESSELSNEMVSHTELLKEKAQDLELDKANQEAVAGLQNVIQSLLGFIETKLRKQGRWPESLTRESKSNTTEKSPSPTGKQEGLG